MVTLYNVISSNGYITERDGKEYFIPDGVWDDFLKLCAVNDALVMGRKTYEAIQGYDKKLLASFEKLAIKKIVVSKNPLFNLKKEYIKANSPKDALSLGKNTLLSSGPSLNTICLKEGLIDSVILNVLPKPIDGSLKVFESDIDPLLVPISEEIREGRVLHFYALGKSSK